MKTKLLLMLLLWAGVAWGPDNVKSGGNYYFNYIPAESLTYLENSSKNFNNDKSKIVEILDGNTYNIRVTKIEKGSVYFVFGEFVESIQLEKRINKMDFGKTGTLTVKNLSSGDFSNKNMQNKAVYSLPVEIFEKNTKPLYDKVEYRVGAYTVPFKLRLKNFSFESNINIGVNLGGKIRVNRKVENGFAFEPLIGFGLSSIKLDDSNSTAIITTNVSAFTVNTGVLFHLTNNINFGITYGFDNTSKRDRLSYRWIHNSKGWFGLGINVSFSNQSENTTKIERQNK